MIVRRQQIKNQVEQLFKVFSLCGSPRDDYWRKMKLSPTFKPPQGVQVNALVLLLQFFSTPPLPCDLSELPVVYKEEVMDPAPSHDGRKPKQRQRSQIRKDNKLKTEEQ
ncbi:unnamed protein product [Urochloa humidicola]